MPLWRLSGLGGESDRVVRVPQLLWAALAAMLPLMGGLAWWLHETSQAHAGEHIRLEERLDRSEANHPKVMAKLEAIDRDIRSIMIKVGAERAAREALHNQR